MLTYLLRRLLATIPVMGIVAFVVFALLYIVPGDPAAIIAERPRRAPRTSSASAPASASTAHFLIHNFGGRCGSFCTATSAPRSSITSPSQP